MKRHCAVKYRMYPNRAQAALIDRTIGCARFIYNQMLETRIGTYKATGKSCNPTPAQYKDRYPFLREVDSIAIVRPTRRTTAITTSPSMKEAGISNYRK